MKPLSNGTATSNAAAASMVPHVQRMRRLVLKRITDCGRYGSTCDEVERVLGLSHQGCSPRFTELTASGVIVRTADRRQTRSGRTAFVYIARQHAV